jgi:response regulator RpfG family c-di-GMP phosphodiesterase
MRGNPMEPILVVDDEPNVRALLRHWVEVFGYEPVEAGDADHALMLMDDGKVGVAVCDVRMPGHDGLWLTGQIRDKHPETAVILASGMDDGTVASRGAELGAIDYLVKPFGTERLANSLRRAVDWHRDAVCTRAWIDRLNKELAERRERLERVLRGGEVPNWADDPRLQEFELDAKAVWGASALTRIVEWRRWVDPQGCAAAERVMRFATATARRLGVEERDIQAMHAAALLHDLGLLTIPRALVDKPADFTTEERALVRQHPLIAFNLLQRHDELSAVASVVLSAYEGFAGHGYPQGLVGDEIPMASRILAVAIAYEAMTTIRPHRGAVPSAEAILELVRCRGTQFDPTVVDTFVQVLTTY